MERLENNRVYLSGKVIGSPEYSHELHGEKFYRMFVCSERLSGREDMIPVVMRERILSELNDCSWKNVHVRGTFRSYNMYDGEKRRLVLNVFADEAEFLEQNEDSDINFVYLEGFICKQPLARTTPVSNRKIADLMIAVNRPSRKNDYIPCICWGKGGEFAESLSVGTAVSVEGRIQSREYIKHLDDGNEEVRTAYEVSISNIRVKEIPDED